MPFDLVHSTTLLIENWKTLLGCDSFLAETKIIKSST